MASTPPLSQAVGYGIVLGLGFAFAFGMMVCCSLLVHEARMLTLLLLDYHMDPEKVLLLFNILPPDYIMNCGGPPWFVL